MTETACKRYLATSKAGERSSQVQSESNQLFGVAALSIPFEVRLELRLDLPVLFEAKKYQAVWISLVTNLCGTPCKTLVMRRSG